jgi:hypothetical protein
MYILDTNVVSELRKAKANRADANVTNWAQNVPSPSLFLSVITILELEMGTLLVERKDKKQGALLRLWLDNHVLPAFSDRVLPVDTAIVRSCAGLHVPHAKSDRDSLIAATALVHGFTVVTRNVSDFEPMGVKIYNPWRG